MAVVHGLATYTDQLRRGQLVGLWPTLDSYFPAYLPWFIYSASLYVLLARDPARATQPRRVAACLAFFAVAFYVPQVCYQVLWDMRVWRQPLSTFPTAFAAWPKTYWLVDFGLFLATFAVVAATVAVQTAIANQQERQRVDAENLALRLDIERHRLAALRAQLEPHFLFNALNAISGLVRGENKALALSALQQLSALLRYALVAAGRERVSLREELEFARDYIALQALRYGGRLRFTVTGETDEVVDADVPPLLLQPLIENAIRHDLECHEGEGDIHLDLKRAGPQLVIRITNPMHPDATANPGTGLGLAATRDRLALLYGPSSSCVGAAHDGRFTVELILPAHSDD
ncbi:MAG: histidine kinase [Gemmatimonadota bacterium]|nr:histidine kinase [Gemmatimonadota bacterium]